MSKTLVVVGAGPGLGMGVARAFGRRGFRVGLVARTPDRLAALVADLAGLGVEAAAFPADIRDRAALATALAAAKDALGPIDVLEYSPSPSGPITTAVRTTAESVTAQLDLHLLGAVTAVGQVLPDMRARGAGTLLLTTGVSSTIPAPFLANVGAAMAGLRNWAHTLHAELKPEGIHAATVTIASGVVPGGGEADPDAIGERYHRLYQQADRVEEVIGDLDAFRALVTRGALRSAIFIGFEQFDAEPFPPSGRHPFVTLSTDDPDEPAAKPDIRGWRRVRRIAGRTAGVLVGGPLIAFWVAYLVLDVRSPQEVLAGLEKTVVLRYADGSELLKVVPDDGDRMFVPYGQVPAKLRDAIIATEDPTFWDNQGFDPTGIGRAFLTGVGGGSGITQQYIKKSTGDEEATLGRKFAELVLATKITQEQSKEEIFESYVNIISFGRGTFGPAAAMNAYFGKKLDDSITWSEAAFLAGMIQSPSVHDPAASGDAHAARRWQYVRDKLVGRGYVGNDEPMAYPGGEIQPPSETRAGRVTYDEFHIKQQVLAELEQDGFPLSRLQQANLTVETTLDRGRQDAAKKALRDRLDGEPAVFRGAVVAIDPSTGAVRAYNGGDQGVRDYAGTPHALGTAFHPFTFTAALLHGFGPDQPIPAFSKVEFLGEDFQYPEACGKKCTPRRALETHAAGTLVALAKKLGPEAVSEAARQAGIPDAVDGVPTLREKDGFLIGPGIAIGRYPLRPLDVAGAYGTFAAEGRRATPHLVAKVRDESGSVVWEHQDTAAPAFGDEAASRRVATAVTDALGTTLPDGRPAALRTGEAEHGNSPDNQDAWAVGYTPQLVTAVWIGSDDERRLKDAAGRKLTGDAAAADVWRTFMTAARP